MDHGLGRKGNIDRKIVTHTSYEGGAGERRDVFNCGGEWESNTEEERKEQ